jgi:hypothetical protein
MIGRVRATGDPPPERGAQLQSISVSVIQKHWNTKAAVKVYTENPDPLRMLLFCVWWNIGGRGSLRLLAELEVFQK